MRYLIYGDVHWSQYSSILRKRGNNYSLRLEKLIETMNWIEFLGESFSVNEIVCLGDFFDKENLNSEEITALTQIHWAENIKHSFLVGNHETGRNDMTASSSHLFNLIPQCFTYSAPTSFEISDGVQVLYLPYMLDSNDVGISDYLPKDSRVVVFSHNDIRGIQMGGFVSKTGLNIDDIENSNIELFINGHYHNGSDISSKIINLGNISGQNFGEDATQYEHHIMILDTDKRSIEYVENPYALNFYKIDSKSINKITKPNAVVSVICDFSEKDSVKELLDDNSNIVEHRISVQYSNDISAVSEKRLEMLDHLKEFEKFVKETLGTSEVVLEELSEVMR